MREFLCTDFSGILRKSKGSFALESSDYSLLKPSSLPRTFLWFNPLVIPTSKWCTSTSMTIVLPRHMSLSIGQIEQGLLSLELFGTQRDWVILGNFKWGLILISIGFANCPKSRRINLRISLILLFVFVLVNGVVLRALFV